MKRRSGNKNKKAVLLKSAAVIVTLAAVLLLPSLARYGADVRKQKRLQQTQISNPAEINRDYVCELVIPGSQPGAQIRFPVVRGRDNQKYLHTAFSGEESLLGAIFMDYRCGGDSSPHTIIYGHDAQDHHGNKLMFGVLRSYLEEAFRAAHPELHLVHGHTTKRFRLFAVKVTDTSDDAYRLDFSADRSFAEFAEQMGAPKGTKEILTLSTCLGGDGNMRLLVQGALL